MVESCTGQALAGLSLDNVRLTGELLTASLRLQIPATSVGPFRSRTT